jgi:hypothetical protein
VDALRECLLLRCLTRPEFSIRPRVRAFLIIQPIARKSAVVVSDFASSSSTSVEVSVSRFLARRLMTARADLLHCGLVGVAGVVMCDFAFGRVTKQVEGMGCASPLCGLHCGR